MVSRDHFTSWWRMGTQETEENIAKGLGRKAGGRWKTDRDRENKQP